MVYAAEKVKPFVVLMPARGRCGSTYFIESLKAHPEIDARLEVLYGLTDADKQLQTARDILTPNPQGPFRAIGFKTKLSDVVDRARLEGLLRDLGARIILLRRRNRVKQVISAFRAEELHPRNQDWNLYREADRPGPLVVPIQRFDFWLKRLEDADRDLREYVKSLGLPTLAVHYEDLLIFFEAAMARTFAFLEVPWQPVSGSALKNTSDDLREALANFEELKGHYRNTPYEEMFDEVLAAGGITPRGIAQELWQQLHAARAELRARGDARAVEKSLSFKLGYALTRPLAWLLRRT